MGIDQIRGDAVHAVLSDIMPTTLSNMICEYAKLTDKERVLYIFASSDHNRYEIVLPWRTHDPSQRRFIISWTETPTIDTRFLLSYKPHDSWCVCPLNNVSLHHLMPDTLKIWHLLPDNDDPLYRTEPCQRNEICRRYLNAIRTDMRRI